MGIGLSRFKIVYGYNLALSNKNFEKVNKNNISINFLFSLRKIKDRGSSHGVM